MYENGITLHFIKTIQYYPLSNTIYVIVYCKSLSLFNICWIIKMISTVLQHYYVHRKKIEIKHVAHLSVAEASLLYSKEWMNLWSAGSNRLCRLPEQGDAVRRGVWQSTSTATLDGVIQSTLSPHIRICLWLFILSGGYAWICFWSKHSLKYCSKLFQAIYSNSY